MIVVAIIGILAAVAIPQYQNYIAKSQMTRVVGELSALKTAAETQLMEGILPSSGSLGFTGSDLIRSSDTQAPKDQITVSTFSAQGAGTIEATMDGSASTAVKTAKVTLDRDVNGTWTCYITPPTGTTGWKKEFAPRGCPVSN